MVKLKPSSKTTSYIEIQPNSLLKEYIDCYWLFKYRETITNNYMILPDGCFDLMYIFDDNKLLYTRLTGLWEKAVTVNYSKHITVLGIRFKISSLKVLFKPSIKPYLNNSLLIPEDFLGFKRSLIEDLFSFGSDKLIEAIQNYYLNLLRDCENPLSSQYLSLLTESKGYESVEAISKRAGISTRHLSRIIKNETGISTKKYLKLIKFKDFMQKKDIHYYDQSHLNKSFIDICNSTPISITLKTDVRFLQYDKFFK